MFLDAKNEFSTAQTIATAVSTNIIDLTPLKAAARDIGIGQPIYLVLTTPTTLAGTSPTLTVAIQTDDNTAFSSPAVLATSAAYAPADFANGPIVIPLPSGAEKYLRLSYTAGGTVTAGTVTAGLTLDAQRLKVYPRNYTV